MALKKSKKESQLDVIARNVATLVGTVGGIKKTMATKDDIRDIRAEMSTKKDLFEMETRIREDMATKDGLHDLEAKLIEDTSVLTGVEQKHHRSHAQRIARLEKEVFHETP